MLLSGISVTSFAWPAVRKVSGLPAGLIHEDGSALAGRRSRSETCRAARGIWFPAASGSPSRPSRALHHVVGAAAFGRVRTALQLGGKLARLGQPPFAGAVTLLRLTG